MNPARRERGFRYSCGRVRLHGEPRLDDTALKQLFLEARTHRPGSRARSPTAVLQELVDLMKMGPDRRQLPAGPHHLREVEGGQGAPEAASDRRQSSTRPWRRRSAAIIGYDLKFYEHPPKGQEPLQRLRRQARARRTTAALRNGSLQGGYFILAARALGLDAGPMSGFDNAGVDKEFFAGTDVKSNFLCNLGYGDPAGAAAARPALCLRRDGADPLACRWHGMNVLAFDTCLGARVRGGALATRGRRLADAATPTRSARPAMPSG